MNGCRRISECSSCWCMVNLSVSEVRHRLEAMPAFSHVPREFHVRHTRYRRHYTKGHHQPFDFASEIAALHRMHGAICFLCGETDAIPLAQIIAAPFEDHLCVRCQANLTRIIERHSSHTVRLRAVGQLPMLRELTQLCTELEQPTRHEHVRL